MPRKPTTPRPIKLAGYTVQAFRGPNEDGLWYYKIASSVDGKRSWKALGWLTRESAEAAIIKASQEPGVTQEAAESEEIKTVKDLLECWLGAQKERQDLKPASFATYRSSCKILTGSIGSLLISRVGQRDLETWRDQTLKGGLSPRYTATCYTVLRLAWKWGQGVSEGMTRALPKITIRIPEETVYNHYTPSREEVEDCIACCEGWTAAGQILLMATGARVSEIAALRWDDVKVTEQAVLLRLNGKTGIRTTPISRSTWNRVTDIMGIGIHGYVSGLETVIQGVSAIRTPMDRVQKNQKLKPYSPHGLRRLKVDSMARAHVDVATAARFTGHSPEVMLRAYRTVSPEDLMGAMEAVEAASNRSLKGSGTK